MSVKILVQEVKRKRSGVVDAVQPDLHGESVQLAINGLINRFQQITVGLRSLSVMDRETLTSFIDDARSNADALVAAVTTIPSAEARDAEIARVAADKAGVVERKQQAETAHENAVHEQHVEENEAKAERVADAKAEAKSKRS